MSDLFALVRDFADRPRAEQLVDRGLLELCRVRVEQVLGSPGAGAIDWDRLTDVERACLKVAEQYTIDPHGVTDADMADVCRHLSPPAVVALLCALATFDGLGRFHKILDIEPPVGAVI